MAVRARKRLVLSTIERERLAEWAPRPGTPRRITDAQVRDVLARTRSEPPPGRNHWTTRTMAAASGLSQSAVSRIWRSAGLNPGSSAPGGAGDNEGVSGEQALGWHN